MIAIYQRELRSYFTGFTGYVFMTFILLFGGIYTSVINLYNGVTSFEYALSGMSFVFIVAIPILTMRVFAEEKRQKTDLLLYSLPCSMTSIVLGKYFAMLTVLLCPLCVMAVYPIVLNLFGNVNLAVAYGALLAFFLVGAVLIAVGMLVSSLCENQAIAAAGCFVLVLINYFISDLATFVSAEATTSLFAIFCLIVVAALIVRYLTGSSLAAGVAAIIGVIVLVISYSVNKQAFEGLFARILTGISVFDRFFGFVEGIFDLGGVIFFVSVAALLIFYTVQAMEKRRYS